MNSTATDFAATEKIADAVLFEGYILYPYRPSSIKNQKRWNFGTLFPRAYAESKSPQESWRFRAEMLLRADHRSRISARVRFLEVTPPEGGAEHGWEEGFVRMRDFEGMLDEFCQGIERTFDLGDLAPQEADRAPRSRRGQPMAACLTLRAEALSAGLYRLHASFANESPVGGTDESASRTSAQRSAFHAAHLLLHIDDGEFVSLLDPGEDLEAATAECTLQGVFPVLAGEEPSRSDVLCSPIILYDYPQVAPESAGDFFDGTEMDEMLALRVMTLTDSEKDEMRAADPHARAVLERIETLPQDHLLKIHGAVRGMKPAAEWAQEIDDTTDGVIDPWDPFAERPPLESVRIFGADVHLGDRVRLWPQKNADIMDMAMEGKVAIVEAIEQDLEDQVQLAVVLEDDPGRDMGMLRQAGHRFFFFPEEIEPLAMETL